MSYRIPEREPKYLEVYIGNAKQPRRVPLMSSLPAPWVLRVNAIRKADEDERGMAWFEFAYELFREFVGPQVDKLTSDEINDLFEAWSDANQEQDGAEAGE